MLKFVHLVNYSVYTNLYFKLVISSEANAYRVAVQAIIKCELNLVID